MAKKVSEPPNEHACPSIKTEIRNGPNGKERTDTWYCRLALGHTDKHRSINGHRVWTDEQAWRDYRDDDIVVEAEEVLVPVADFDALKEAIANIRNRLQDAAQTAHALAGNLELLAEELDNFEL